MNGKDEKLGISTVGAAQIGIMVMNQHKSSQIILWSLGVTVL